MSRLDELIQELCPAGVELRKIKEGGADKKLDQGRRSPHVLI